MSEDFAMGMLCFGLPVLAFTAIAIAGIVNSRPEQTTPRRYQPSRRNDWYCTKTTYKADVTSDNPNYQGGTWRVKFPDGSTMTGTIKPAPQHDTPDTAKEN